MALADETPSLVNISSEFSSIRRVPAETKDTPIDETDVREPAKGYFAIVVPESEPPYSRFFADAAALARFANTLCNKPNYLLVGYGYMIPYTQAPMRVFVLPDSRCVQFYPTPNGDFKGGETPALAAQVNNFLGVDFKIPEEEV